MFRAGIAAMLVAGAGSILTAQQVPPAEPVVQLDPFTVTAHPSGADERTAAVWVVVPDTAVGAPLQMAGVLAGVPGVHLSQPGGPGGRATLFLRGADENHTLVFLDGVPLNDPTNSRGGAVDFSLLEPSMMRSAAVVRGPASVRHGPDALAGVVHLGTGAPETDAVRVGGEAGDHFGRVAGSFDRRASEQTAVSLGAAWFDDGDEEDGSHARRRYYRAGVAVDAPLAVRLSAWRIENDAEAFPDDSGGARYAVWRDLEERRDRQTAGALRLETDWAERHWVLSMDAAQFDSSVVSPGVAPGPRDPMGLPASESDTRLQRLRINTLVEHKVRGWTFSGGVDFQREKGRDDSTLFFGPFELPASFEMTRDRAGVFAEGVGDVRPNLTLAVGGRFDHYSDDFSHGTVRAGLLGRLDGATQWRVNLGNAFKPPSFYALSNPLVGNAELKPERSRTLDGGLRRALAGNRGLIDISVFATDIEDGVDLDPGPPPRLVNRSAIRSRGAEAALAWQVSPALSASGSLTYTDARSEPDGERMRMRPRWRGSVSCTWRAASAVTLTAAVIAVDRVPDTSIPTGAVMLDGWARLDLAAAWRVRPELELVLAVDNTFDADYEEAVGFPSPGRRLRAGLRADF